MSGREETELTPDGSVRVQRACDSCRARKIRCDKGSPCSNCRASNLSCRTTSATQRIQRQRIHVSDEYEKKINRMEGRLHRIEAILETMMTKLDGISQHMERNVAQKNSGVRNPDSVHEMTSPSPPPFEGETTLNAQSEFAREFVEKAVGHSTYIGQNNEIQAALASLKSMVNRQSDFAATKSDLQPLFDKVTTDTDVSILEGPPWEAVNEAIERATLNPTVSFAVIYPYIKLCDMKQLFKDTCNAPNENPIGRRILVYGILHSLFKEYSFQPSMHSKTPDYRKYAHHAVVHLQAAISKLNLFLPASYENILALLIASSYAVELGKTSLSWLMNSTAAGLCQRLGYHRSSSMKDDTPEERAAKIHVFWFIYSMDKMLSLQLGRSSAIQDWDVSLPYPGSFDGPSQGSVLGEGNSIQHYWVNLAKIQGETYERLFSPAAFLKSARERAEIVRDLVQRLDRAWSERGTEALMHCFAKSAGLFPHLDQTPCQSIPVEAASRGQVYLWENTGGDEDSQRDLYYYSDAVAHLSTVTLIHRAVQTDNAPFSSECLHAAREALRLHQICSEQFNVKDNEEMWSSYLHWTIFQSPFTPFIVLFCHTISTTSRADLHSLSDFVTSLESTRSVSSSAERFYKMCQLFLLIVTLCIDAKSRESHISTHNGGIASTGHSLGANGKPQDYSGLEQIDPYLSALGLVPYTNAPVEGLPSAANGSGYLQQGPAAFGEENQSSLQNWFSGSRYIMGLMEDDFSMPDMPDWNS